MGAPPLAYLTNWRMRLASKALPDGASVSEAAARVDYQSESAFNDAFRRWSGTAPGFFRKERKSRNYLDRPHALKSPQENRRPGR
ncbi:hypothetical protein CDO44_23955 [Pigmentiphaga sp. NML080357]|uniref:helix-turn-helix domain-containing protein n=1 Tax=Pigmentiphaga sp. NML080357 TaxID=2008675 RepID=UPI000B40C695|nr:hypothetical protein CDO44_23955 [Pigmentiphaga sp. NML080357]